MNAVTENQHAADRLPHCVVCDLDGTLSNDSERRKRLKNGTWADYYTDCSLDRINTAVWALLRHEYLTGKRIFIVTGRPEFFRTSTLAWLSAAALGITTESLLMRPSDSAVRETLLKAQMLQKISEAYCIDCFIDCRRDVTDICSRFNIDILCRLTAPYPDFIPFEMPPCETPTCRFRLLRLRADHAGLLKFGELTWAEVRAKLINTFNAKSYNRRYVVMNINGTAYGFSRDLLTFPVRDNRYPLYRPLQDVRNFNINSVAPDDAVVYAKKWCYFADRWFPREGTYKTINRRGITGKAHFTHGRWDRPVVRFFASKRHVVPAVTHFEHFPVEETEASLIFRPEAETDAIAGIDSLDESVSTRSALQRCFACCDENGLFDYAVFRQEIRSTSGALLFKTAVEKSSARWIRHLVLAGYVRRTVEGSNRHPLQLTEKALALRSSAP